MRATKKATTMKAIEGRRPGGVEWKTAAGRVFMGDELMSASLSLTGAHGDDYRRIAAKVHRLAAEAWDRSGLETWVIYVNGDHNLVIELSEGGARARNEATRASCLLVSLLEGVS